MVMLMPDGLGPQVMRGSTTGDRLTKVMDVPNRSGFLVLSGDTAYVVGVQGAGPIAPSITAVDSTGAHARHAPPCTGQADRAFDLLLVDPPYATPDTEVAGWLTAALAHGWLAEGATVVVERPTRGGPFAWPEPLRPVRERRYGETTLHLARCYRPCP